MHDYIFTPLSTTQAHIPYILQFLSDYSLGGTDEILLPLECISLRTSAQDGCAQPGFHSNDSFPSLPPRTSNCFLEIDCLGKGILFCLHLLFFLSSTYVKIQSLMIFMFFPLFPIQLLAKLFG